ncbi:diguanylate cyclase [Vibrio quintilis]|uniref:Diguanylate cyclase DosC n=1 Tax=Vibrio quintilis TaxID=1117707 RepID=A0A1M7YPV7_9VIBR|nr:diguanylate cyclase [Vibrio quintilis]SHO54605.1 Diguanylate cyclase DosC [Vibrio quintilis]
MHHHVLLRPWTAIIFLLILGCAYTGLIEFLFLTHQQAMRHDIQQRAEDELALVRYKLEASILADAYAAKSLSMLISVHSQAVSQFWQSVSQQTIEQGKYIRSVSLAPDDVIRYVYPVEENKKAIGTDFRSIPEQWEAVQKARQMEEVVVSGPVKLVQGGTAVIVRSPVFLDPLKNQHYWGSVSIVVDIDKLFSFLNFTDLASHFDIAVMGKDFTEKEGNVFWGKPQVFQHVFVQEMFYFPSGTWQIAIAEKQGNVDSRYSWYQYYLVRIIGYSLFVVLTMSFLTVYRLYKKSNQLSMCDELTQLPNRRFFMDRLSKVFENKKQRGAASGPGFSLLCIDIDKFKLINDQYGHFVGDQVLIECARRIRNAVRDSDCVARIGGDEFLVLLIDGVHSHYIRGVIDRIRHTFELIPIQCEGHSILLEVSIGYTTYMDEMENVSDMIKFADSNMYAEKYQR